MSSSCSSRVFVLGTGSEEFPAVPSPMCPAAGDDVADGTFWDVCDKFLASLETELLESFVMGFFGLALEKALLVGFFF